MEVVDATLARATYYTHVYPEADYTHMHRVASTLVHSIRRLGGMHSIELARARTKSIKRVLLARVLTQSCPANTNNEINNT